MRIRGLDLALVALLPSVALVLSCDDDDPAKPKPPEPTVETHVVRDVDYIKYKYFLIDTPTSFAGAKSSTLRIYLTVTQQDLVEDPTIQRLPTWAIPDSTMDGEQIDAALEAIGAGGDPPHGLHDDFRLLERGVDYSLLTQPGDSLVLGFALKAPIPPSANRAVAVSYINGFGVPIGGQIVNNNELVLEIIKAPDPAPFGHFGSTFQMMMRNAYDLGFGSIDPAHLTVKIEQVNTTDPTPATPEGSDVPWAQIFGIDLYDAAGTGPPDGKVDKAYYGWTDDLGHSILWMPAYRAFAPPADLVQTWTDGAFEFSGAYLPQYETSQRIYTERLNTLDEQDVHQYVIKATLTTPAP